MQKNQYFFLVFTRAFHMDFFLRGIFVLSPGTYRVELTPDPAAAIQFGKEEVAREFSRFLKKGGVKSMTPEELEMAVAKRGVSNICSQDGGETYYDLERRS